MSGINYVLNPSPETNTTSWSAINAVLAQDTTQTQPGAGAYCLKVTASSSSAVTVSQNATGLTVGLRYTATLFVKIPATVGQTFYLTAGASSGQGTNWSTRGVLGEWCRIRVTFTATSATQTISATSVGAVPNALAFYVDRLAVVDGEIPGPYFDGSYPQCAWTGAAYASTSTCAAFQNYPTTSDEPVVVGGLCLNTLSWNTFSRAGRRTPPAFRGSSTMVAGQSGHQFVANRPLDVGSWSVNLWVLGQYPDGSIPPIDHARFVYERNVATIQQAFSKSWQPVVICSWQPDGTVRTASAQLTSQMENSVQAGGLRGEYAFTFEILAGWWKDAISAVVAGVAGAAWSNQALTLNPLIGGTAPIEDSVVVVHGPATNPRITTDSGVWVQLNDTLNTTDTWTVDCGAWTSLKNAVSNLANVTHGGHPRFLSIPAGELFSAPRLTLTASATGVATNLTVTASRSHLAA